MEAHIRNKLDAIYQNNGHPIYRSKSRCDTCKRCLVECKKRGTSLNGPFACWHVGNSYGTGGRPKVLFVGKWVETGDGEYKDQSSIKHMYRLYPFDERGQRKDWAKSPFWHFIEDVGHRIYGEPAGAFKYAAITNLVKCFPFDRKEKVVVNNCLSDLEVFGKEKGVLKPDFVVIMTGWFASDYVHTMTAPYKKNRATGTCVSDRGCPKYIWTWHPQRMRGKSETIKKEILKTINAAS